MYGCVCGCMGRKVSKNLYLNATVVDRLEEEDHPSGTVERLLREEFGMPTETATND